LKRQLEYTHDDPLHGQEESYMESTGIIQYKLHISILDQVISHSIGWKLLYMSDSTLRSHLLSPFEYDLLVSGHSSVCHANAWYIV